MNDNKKTITDSSVDAYKDLVEEMISLYKRKNADYGNSVYISLDEDGLIASKVRIGDKLNRFSNLIKKAKMGDNISVVDESMRDTILDLSNYANITYAWYKSMYVDVSNGSPDHSKLFIKSAISLIDIYSSNKPIIEKKRVRLLDCGLSICSDRMNNQFERFALLVKENRIYEMPKIMDALQQLTIEAVETVLYIDREEY